MTTCTTLWTPPTPRDYDTANEFLHRQIKVNCHTCKRPHLTMGNAVASRKVANNTYVKRLDGHTIVVRLHDTDIVEYRPDGVRLNTGGWLTVTTKDRINNHLPDSWHLGSVNGTWHLTSDTHMLRYTDGATLVQPYKGSRYVPDRRTFPTPEEVKRVDAHNKAMRRLIGKYIAKFTEPNANSTDCTLCITQHTVTFGLSDRPVYVSYGDAMQDTQHLVEHMIDGVYPVGLIHQAVSGAGYNVNYAGVDSIKRALRKYLGTRLYLGATAPAHGKRPITLKETA